MLELKEQYLSIPQEASALARIRSALPALANSETRVAEWLLQSPERITKMSMAQVANACGVSDATVLRFCRSAGFHGFTDLKLAIARDTARPTQMIHDAISPEDDLPTITRKVLMSNVQAICDTLEMMDYKALQQSIDFLETASRILIIGVGTSSPIVQDMHNKFFRMGLNCRMQTDAYLQLMDAALLTEQDVVIGISQSGASLDPTLTLKQARENRAKTICITGNAQSPITEYADVTLLSVSNETRTEAIASRIAQFSIVDALYIALSMRNMERTVKNERKAYDAVIPKTV